jgi:hypothetical protein
MRKTLGLLALGAVAVMLLALAGSGTAVTKPQAFSLIGLPESFVPVAGFSEGAAPELGAVAVITERLHRWDGRKPGARAGRTEILCTVTGKGGHSSPAYCTAGYSLPGGKIVVAGFTRFPAGAGITIPIVGGTGPYANARGLVRVRDLPGFKTNNEFHLLP